MFFPFSLRLSVTMLRNFFCPLPIPPEDLSIRGNGFVLTTGIEDKILEMSKIDLL